MGPALLREPGLDGLEPLGVEQSAQQLAALLRVGPQEAREVPLRQQHHLAELVPAHPDQPVDLLAGLLVRLAHRPPAGPVRAGARAVRRPLAQQGLGPLDGHARADLLRPGLLGDPDDLQPPAAERQLQPDLGQPVGLGVVAAQPVGPAGAGHLAVEGVADRVQHAALARSGGAAQQEQAAGGQRVEVDRLGAGEGAEGGHGQPVESHRGCSAFRSVVSRTRSKPSRSQPSSSGSGSAPGRTCRRKPSAISRSVRPLTRAA